MFNPQQENDNLLNNLSFIDKIKRKYDLTPSIILILGLTTLFFCNIPHLPPPLRI